MENYVVSARKYRPETFDTVVGQEHVTQTLLNEIKNNHLAQAFLFNGPRGVGKTTCARILAKEINKDSIEDETYDYSYNIFELDAASNNSVDDIRLLNEQVRIPPQIGKYKIYIIDEVHMLSAAAFNAFLKTLEEPPSYAIFILATTERHKIIPTILSRCQVFNFNRIAVSDMVAHLKKIAEKESVVCEDQALHIIAQKADGALRDALTIFDQMASVGESNITYANVIENLSVLDYDHYFKLTDAFMAEDVAEVMLLFDNILTKGFDAQIFLNGLSSHFRDLMVVRDERTLSLLDVPPHIHDSYKQKSQALSQGFLVNAIHIANQYDQSYKSSRNQRLHVELALIKICYLNTALAPAEKKKLELVKPDSYAEASVKKDLAKPIQEAKAALTADVAQPSTAKGESSETVLSSEVKTIKQEPDKNQKKEAIEPSKKVAKLGNLDALVSVKKPPIEIKTEDVEEADTSYGNDIVSLEAVQKVLENFEQTLAQTNQTRLQSIFKFIKPEVVNQQVNIYLNKQHRVQMDDIRVDLLQFLRKHLNNSSLQLELIEVKKKVEGQRAYTSQEKFEAMAKKNPLLNDLKNALNLKVE